MPSNPRYRIQNKSDKPDNIVAAESKLMDACHEMEINLPGWLKDYTIYLKGSISLTSRKAYLNDLLYFLDYLIRETDITEAAVPRKITLEEFQRITAREINWYLDYLSRYITIQNERETQIENHSRSLSRKRSSLSVLFKYLFRSEMIPVNITDAFNPIKLPKPQPDAIKRLEIEEVSKMMEIVMSGEGLNEREKKFWSKTRYRDRAILVLFVTYGLRLKELQQLNISSFNYGRGEFRIFRKRGKEVLMPINKTCEQVVKEYINLERASDNILTADAKDALFLSNRKTRLAERSIQVIVNKYTSIAMDVPRGSGYSPHKLRATAATSLIEYGFSIFDVQNLLDHDNVTTTQLYAAHKRHAKRDLINQYEVLPENKKPSKD